jgi:DNA-binding beta-propeller fold protein YncE
MCQNGDEEVSPMRLRWAGLGIFCAGCASEADPSEPSGLLAVANLDGNEVLLFDRATGAAVAPLLSGDTLPEGVAPEGFEPAAVARSGGELIVTNFRSGEVLAFDPIDGAWLRTVHANGPESSLRLQEPCDLQPVPGGPGLPARGGFAVLGNDSRNLVLLDRDGAVQAELGGEGSPDPLRAPHGFALSDDGRAFVATSPTEPDLGLVQVWDVRSGERLYDFAAYGEIEEGTDAVLGPDGVLWVVDWFGSQVVRFDPDSGEKLDVFAGPSEGVDRPISLVFDDAGVPWLLDQRGVVRLDAGDVVVDGAANGFDWARGLSFF